MKTFTVHSDYPVHYRAESRSKRRMLSAPAAPLVDELHTTVGWKSQGTEHPTYVAACH